MPSVKQEFDEITRRKVDRMTQLRNLVKTHLIEPTFGKKVETTPKPHRKEDDRRRKVARKAIKLARRKQRS
jgi:hypothetical protein